MKGKPVNIAETIETVMHAEGESRDALDEISVWWDGELAGLDTAHLIAQLSSIKNYTLSVHMKCLSLEKRLVPPRELTDAQRYLQKANGIVNAVERLAEAVADAKEGFESAWKWWEAPAQVRRYLPVFADRGVKRWLRAMSMDGRSVARTADILLGQIERAEWAAVGSTPAEGGGGESR